MPLINETTGVQIAADVRRLHSPFSRMRGFIGRVRVGPQEGLWLDNCCAVHTMGMRVPLDLIFLDGRRRVVKALANVPPLRPAVYCRGARAVIELGAGAIARNDVLRGDVLKLVTQSTH